MKVEVEYVKGGKRQRMERRYADALIKMGVVRPSDGTYLNRAMKSADKSVLDQEVGLSFPDTPETYIAQDLSREGALDSDPQVKPEVEQPVEVAVLTDGHAPAADVAEETPEHTPEAPAERQKRTYRRRVQTSE
jgi:hypothetical protein